MKIRIPTIMLLLTVVLPPPAAHAQMLDAKVISLEAAKQIATASEAEARKLDGKVVGALGVSGVTSEQDAIVAQAGAGAIR